MIGAEPYRDRVHAGQELGRRLQHLAGRDDVVVVGLLRGGLPVAAAVSEAIGACLDALIVRKVGLPAQPELAMGAITEVGGNRVVVRNDGVIRDADISAAEFDAACRRELERVREADDRYRSGRAALPVAGRTVVLVDDGLATGATMRAAVAATKQLGAAHVVVAVPFGSPRTCASLAEGVDELVCPWRPDRFFSVSAGYHDFHQVSDDEVRELLGAGS